MGTTCSIMKVFSILALVPLSYASQLPYGHPPAYPPIEPAYAHPEPAYAHPEPAYGHPAPAYGPPAPGYGYAPAYPAPHYEHPKHNCSVQDVIEPAEVCTPAFETVCSPIELVIKKIVDKEQCYPVTRTVCTESIEEIANEICTYSYQQRAEATTAKIVEVTFDTPCKVQMVTVCQPAPKGYGHGHGGYGHGYGHNYCQEVAQETCYNVPVLTVVEPAVEVAYPEPIKTCVNKPISLVRIACEDLTAEKCITVPEVEEATEVSEKCITQLAAPACQDIELTLPKQVCVELVYGHAEDTHKHEPAPAYAPAPHHA